MFFYKIFITSYVENNSDNDGIMNQKTDDSPIVFGVLPEDIKRWSDGYDVEMYQCTYNGDWTTPIILNVLHVSTNLKLVSDEMKEIIKFLKSRNFNVNSISKPKDWTDADVLIIGTDGLNTVGAQKMIDRFPSNFGIVRTLDALLYGPDGKLIVDTLLLKELYFTDDSLKLECISMIISNIRRQLDYILIRGIFAARSIEIESCIDGIMNGDTSYHDDIAFGNKIKYFKKNIKNKNQFDSNAELFFTAMSIVRRVRNDLVHTPQSLKDDGLDCYMHIFNEIADECGRNDLCKVFKPGPRFQINVTKHFIRLASYSLEWIKEYSKRYGQK